MLCVILMLYHIYLVHNSKYKRQVKDQICGLYCRQKKEQTY